VRAYQNAPHQVALLTKHLKQLIVSPILADGLGIKTVHVDSFDTDSLGTFDNKVKRDLSAKQTALKKAHLACEFSGLSAGIGSEGSFNSELGFGIVDQEILAFVDSANALTVCAIVAKPINLALISATDETMLYQKLAKFDPHQAWHLLSSAEQDAVYLATGLSGADNIIAAANRHGFEVTLTPDFRAMHCPARREIIALAAQDLVTRLCSLCPNCGHPDFVFSHKISGLPCELCDSPTALVKVSHAHCVSCQFQQSEPNERKSASSFYCELCNP
jgi:hypothetical protein